ncbi:MAG: cobalamin biosynthesis protein [Candidatus Bathyarchaeia archaeon]
MLSSFFTSYITPLIILALALLIDFSLGEPPDRIHPTVWMGKVIIFLKPKFKSKNPKVERIKGALLCLSTVLVFTLPAYFILTWTQQCLGPVAYIIVAAIMLKPTFALKCMEYYTLPIAKAINAGKVNEAKALLPYIVRRNPEKLDEKQIISAAVESIAEGTVDGITSALFYFALFGVPGAVAFRVINTLDSMVGYKDPEHAEIGWFSAKLDTLANYIPARLTAFLMIIATWILQKNWKNAWDTLKRDKNKTESLNAGWPMATMAGALNIKLEKPDFYTLGDSNSNPITPRHILQALQIMKLTTILFGAFIVPPLLILAPILLGQN